MNERKLAERLAAGDQSALERIIREYTRYVRTVAFNFSRNTLTNEDIDEVVADVFYSLWNAREKLDPDGGLRSYLSAITRNNIKNRFRKAAPKAEDITESEIPSDLSVENAAELGEMLSLLYEGMEKLSPDEREIFYRFYFNGEKSSQIAEKKGTTKAAVDMKLHRTRKKLRDYLVERGYDNV